MYCAFCASLLNVCNASMAGKNVFMQKKTQHCCTNGGKSCKKCSFSQSLIRNVQNLDKVRLFFGED